MHGIIKSRVKDERKIKMTQTFKAVKVIPDNDRTGATVNILYTLDPPLSNLNGDLLTECDCDEFHFNTRREADLCADRIKQARNPDAYIKAIHRKELEDPSAWAFYNSLNGPE